MGVYKQVYYTKYRDSRSPEQAATLRKAAAVRAQIRRSNMTAEQRAEHLQKRKNARANRSPEQILAYKIYDENRRNKSTEVHKLWRMNNPTAAKAAVHRYQAAKREATIDPFTSAELVAHIEELGGRCVYCGGPYEHLDHVYPLSKGGPHALSNLVPSCKPCNLAKSDKLPLQWFNQIGVL